MGIFNFKLTFVILFLGFAISQVRINLFKILIKLIILVITHIFKTYLESDWLRLRFFAKLIYNKIREYTI